MSTHRYSYRPLLARYLFPQAGKVCLLVVILLGGVALQLLAPQILRCFVDAAQAGSPLPILIHLAILLLASVLVRYGLRLAETYLSEGIGWSATNNLRSDLAAHCLNLDIAFHHTHTPGELIERVDGDVTQLSHFFSQLFLQLLSNALLLLGILVTIWLEDWRSGLAFSLFAAIAIWILIGLRDFATQQMQEQRQASANLFGFLEERLHGLDDLRANGATDYTLYRLLALLRQWWRKEMRAALRSAIFGSIVVVWFESGAALALALGAYLFYQGLFSLGTVLLFYSYVRMLQSPLMLLTGELQRLQEARASLTRIVELHNTQPTLIEPAHPPRAGRPGFDSSAQPPTVIFDQVSFRYAGAEQPASSEDLPTLDRLSFQLGAGKKLGLVGRTGSGKSTIARLLLRLYDPQTGSVRLDGVDLRDLPMADLRRQVGIVTQDVQLFQTSVRDNLTLFDRQISDERIAHALSEVGLADWLRSLPAGLETQLAANGNSLSAGEGQLLALARLFLRDPGLVILDEASSRLDPATEQRLDQAIERLLAQRTALIIAHRLTTLKRVDEVLILEDGRLIESGLRAELSADSTSRFASLLQAAQ